jgi:RNA polymerase sigma factor (sigma-70 family)
MIETDLLQRLQQNDEEALASLMAMYYDNLYNYAARFTKDNGLIKDCIQEVFISLWQRRQTASAILSPKFYFLRAVKNKVLKAIHSNNQKAKSAESHDGYDFFHEFSIEKIIIDKQVSEEKAEKIRKTVSLLSKRQKEIIYLKYYQYLDHGQIAELMNISTQSVYNLLHEAIRNLRSLWNKELAG